MRRIRDERQEADGRRMRRRTARRRTAIDPLPAGTRVRALEPDPQAPQVWYTGTIAVDPVLRQAYRRDWRRQWVVWDVDGSGDWVQRTHIRAGWLRMWGHEAFCAVMQRWRGVLPQAIWQTVWGFIQRD